MELVKKGYKKTEVGVIPDDWNVMKLGDIGTCIIGLTYSPSNIVNHGTLVLRSSNVQDNKLAFNDNVFVNSIIPDNLKIKDGDILICVRNGSRNLIGKCAILDKRVVGETFGAFMSVFRTSYSNYIFQVFQSNDIKRQIDENLGATINQITNKVLNSFVVALPPTLTEQKAIADALTDVDELITNLEKLIAKKKAIKQGAMQQLLTPPHKGGKRLDGFSGDWIYIPLGKLANVNMGQSPLSENYNSIGIGLPLIQGNADVSNRKTIVRTFTSQITKRGDIGDIIMSVRAPVGEISRATFQCCLGRGVCSVKYKNDYLYHYLIYFEKSWASFSTGSTFDSVNSKQVNELIIPIPENEQEQNAIASILNDMDIEIEANETKLKKAVLLKQGMMQELLTGKTRLI